MIHWIQPIVCDKQGSLFLAPNLQSLKIVALPVQEGVTQVQKEYHEIGEQALLEKFDKMFRWRRLQEKIAERNATVRVLVNFEVLFANRATAICTTIVGVLCS